MEVFVEVRGGSMEASMEASPWSSVDVSMECPIMKDAGFGGPSQVSVVCTPTAVRTAAGVLCS